MSKSIKLSSGLWNRVERESERAGYSSPQEFVEHVLERELSKIETAEQADDQKEVERRLKGLGYLE
jgi:hypothetical protein